MNVYQNHYDSFGDLHKPLQKIDNYRYGGPLSKSTGNFNFKPSMHNRASSAASSCEKLPYNIGVMN